MDVVSDACDASTGNVADREGNGEGPGTGTGESPLVSGGWGVGMNMVFLTSRRPLLALGFRGVATCCACYIPSVTLVSVPGVEDIYRAQGVCNI